MTLFSFTKHPNHPKPLVQMSGNQRHQQQDSSGQRQGQIHGKSAHGSIHLFLLIHSIYHLIYKYIYILLTTVQQHLMKSHSMLYLPRSPKIKSAMEHEINSLSSRLGGHRSSLQTTLDSGAEDFLRKSHHGFQAILSNGQLVIEFTRSKSYTIQCIQ